MSRVTDVAYFLPFTGQTVGPDDGRLERRWEEFSGAHPEILPHRCNGVTRWGTGDFAVERITYCVDSDRLNDFRFVDSVVAYEKGNDDGKWTLPRS